mmetsp:Transcript_46443/g.92181  ORF Transcript_46443/g.92181 Transcript_46443/m.92181 type:complete len:212 (+) Transcript_46443:835-1470(+)
MTRLPHILVWVNDTCVPHNYRKSPCCLINCDRPLAEECEVWSRFVDEIAVLQHLLVGSFHGCSKKHCMLPLCKLQNEKALVLRSIQPLTVNRVLFAALGNKGVGQAQEVYCVFRTDVVDAGQGLIFKEKVQQLVAKVAVMYSFNAEQYVPRDLHDRSTVKDILSQNSPQSFFFVPTSSCLFRNVGRANLQMHAPPTSILPECLNRIGGCWN